MFSSEPTQTREERSPVIIRNAEPWCGEKLTWTVRGALLLAAALHPPERTGGGEESARRSGANTEGAAAAADAPAVQGAGGRSRKLPVRLHSCGGQHGQLCSADKELSAVTLSVLCAKAGPGHEAALFEERVRDLQRRVTCRVSEWPADSSEFLNYLQA